MFHVKQNTVLKEMNIQKTVCAFLGALAVGLGAFGAHGLKDIVSLESLEVWETATFYLFIHIVAALSVSDRAPKVAWGFIIGAMLFSISLYLMVVTEIKILGPITPLGGSIMLVSWISLAVVFLKGNK